MNFPPMGCALGDYDATLFSAHSHNRCFGESFIRGQASSSLRKACLRPKRLSRLGEAHGVDLPISRTVYEILYLHVGADEALRRLFQRSVKGEFDT